MNKYKKDFSIFQKNRSLVYLDSAATSQKPKIVIDAIKNYYENYNANVRRGLYPISEKATEEVEKVRRKVAKFINAKNAKEIIFVRNTTEAINLVANTWGEENIKKGDVIVTTIMEHHSNFVPWQQLCIQKGAKLEVIDIDKNFQFSIFNFQSHINFRKAKLLAITHVSNVLGTINPIEEIIKAVKKINPDIKVLVDAAQSVPHIKVDVQDLDCDFLAFSGHKMMASTGTGILYGKEELLKEMRPFLYGGEMVEAVSTKGIDISELPFKFEAGTPDIAGIISLGAAIDYLEKVGMDEVQQHERALMVYCLEQMERIDGIIIYGPKNIKDRSGVISFNINGIHPHDIAQILGDMGICIRAGMHCAMPLHTRLGVASIARASFYIYNDKKDVDKLVEGIKKAKNIFRK